MSMQLAGCEEARVAAKSEAKEALAAESTMRQNARSAQEQVTKLEAEIESLKAALKDRNDEIVELKLSVSELKKSQAALRAQAEGMTTEQLCTRCARQGFAEAKERAIALMKQGIKRMKLAVAHAMRVIETTVLPAVQPIVAKARDLYAEHAQAHVEQLKQQFDQHAGPYVLQAEQFYKQHMAEVWGQTALVSSCQSCSARDSHLVCWLLLLRLFSTSRRSRSWRSRPRSPRSPLPPTRWPRTR